jgi:hypothetical protein
MDRVIVYRRLSKGERSALGLDAQEHAIRSRFPNAEITVEANAGGWARTTSPSCDRVRSELGR